MPKKPSGTQIEMLLPIAGKRNMPSTLTTSSNKIRSSSYEKVMSSLRKKGLTRSTVKK